MEDIEIRSRTIARLMEMVNERDREIAKLKAAAQSAPAGEREAFEAWARRPDNGVGKLDLRLCDIGLYYRRETGTAWDGFKAGAAWQRTQSAGVPTDEMVAVASAAYDREASFGATHEQAWHVALSEALAAAPAHPAGRQEQGEVQRLREALETIAAYPYSRDQEMGAAAMRKVAQDALAAQPAINGYACTVPDDCETLHWRGQILSMNELASMAQPAVGEEIMVNAAHDVYTLPLQPSGLDGRGPRFVVHVPAQPAPDVARLVEALEGARKDLSDWITSFPEAAHAHTTIVIARIDAALAAHRKQETSHDNQ